jgi:hypothetical protein
MDMVVNLSGGSKENRIESKHPRIARIFANEKRRHMNRVIIGCLDLGLFGFIWVHSRQFADQDGSIPQRA